jgi:NCAIR mutase (PurE)-related protein
MNVDALRELLGEFKSGRATEQEVLDQLRTLPFEDLGFAKVDHHRSLRRGFPEVIYGQGKTTEHIIAISESLLKKKTSLLATR